MNANEYVAFVFATLTYFSVNGYNAEQKAANEFARNLTNEQARSEIGKASIYWHRTKTACGQPWARANYEKNWIAHRSLPCGTRVVVTSLENGKEITAVVVDRGPFINGRVIDMTPGAAKRIGLVRKQGLMAVRITWYATDQTEIKPTKTERRKRRIRRK